jgi:PKD domain
MCCWLLGSVGIAVGAPAWVAPTDLSGTVPDAEFVDVHADPQGDAIATWLTSQGAENGLVAAVRPIGGPWSAPTVLADSTTASLRERTVAVNSRGDAIVAWTQVTGDPANPTTKVETAYRPAGAVWEPPVEVGEPTSEIDGLAVVLDDSGTATLITLSATLTLGAVSSEDVVAWRGSLGGSWQPSATPLDHIPAAASDPQLGADTAGDVTATWAGGPSGDVVRSAVRPSGQGWSPTVTISGAGLTPEGPALAVDAAGDAVVAWSSFNGAPPTSILAATRTSLGLWTQPQTVTTAGGLDPPSLAIDPSGDAVVGWTATDDGGKTWLLATATLPHGGQWGPATKLASGSLFDDPPSVALDPQGNAVATWTLNTTATGAIVQASERAAGGAWSAPTNLSRIGDASVGTGLAVDAAGDAFTTWTRQANGAVAGTAVADVFDATPPALGAVTIPTATVVGQAVSFSASASDAMSAPGSPSWTFGDGTTATGATVSHAYARVGTFSVQVAVADGAANTVSRSGSITVVAATASGLTLSPSTFKAARAGGSAQAARAAHALHTGSLVHFRLNAAAAVRFTVQRSERGRSVNHKCVKTTRRNRHRHACARTVSVSGSFSRSGIAGTNRFEFRGRLGGRALSAGSYVLVAQPRIGTTNGQPAHAKFSIR